MHAIAFIVFCVASAATWCCIFPYMRQSLKEETRLSPPCADQTAAKFSPSGTSNTAG